MNSPKPILLFIIILTLATLGYSQSTLSGRVVQVLDGKTVVIEISSGKLIAELQYIEVPEPEQQLNGTVREHLEKLVLNKDVVFRSAGFAPGKTFGQLYVNSVDVALQMLRDGAAWHISQEKSGQKASDSDAYEYHQTQAKLENRGVWGVKDLTPAWDFRERMAKEKEELARRLENEENAKRANSKPKSSISSTLGKVEYKMLPNDLPKTSFLDLKLATPKGYIVVGVGYRPGAPDKIFKLIKKPVEGDIACSGFDLPESFVATLIAYSPLCAHSGYGNNATTISDAETYSRSMTRDAILKTATALRMYRVSGNYEEFESKARIAIETVNRSIMFIRDENIRANVMLASEALRDAMLVKASRSGNLGAGLSGSALLALNDKYGLNDVSAYSLDGEIIKAGILYLNDASKDAARLGIVSLKSQSR